MTVAIDTRDLQGRVDLLDLIGRDTRLRKVASTRGGEYAGPCPSCGGEDRLHVQPEQGRWMCRQCHERWSDAIEYLRWHHGLSFADACRALGVEVRDRPATVLGPKTPPPSAGRGHGASRLADDPEEPSAAWRERAERYVAAAERVLWSPAGEPARRWLAARGLAEASIRRSRLGYQTGDAYEPPTAWGFDDGKRVWLPQGVVIPWRRDGSLWQLKVRRPRDTPRYVAIRGGHPAGLYGGETLADHDIAALVEGELDAVLLEQECGDLIGAATLGSASRRLDPLSVGDLLGAKRILCLHDADAAGDRQAARIGEQSARALRLRVPVGKDLTEFVQAGGSVRAWVGFELERLGLLPQGPSAPSPPMSLDDVFAALRERDAVLRVVAGRLDYVGPSPLAVGDPLWGGLAEHQAELPDLFACPRDRCVFCPSVVAPADRIACAEHRRQLDATPMPWEHGRTYQEDVTTHLPMTADGVHSKELGTSRTGKVSSNRRTNEASRRPLSHAAGPASVS